MSLPLELFSCWLSVSENRRDYPHETWSPSRFSPCTRCADRSGKTVCWGHTGPDHIQESVLRLWPLLPHRDSSMVWPDPASDRSHQTWSCSQAHWTEIFEFSFTAGVITVVDVPIVLLAVEVEASIEDHQPQVLVIAMPCIIIYNEFFVKFWKKNSF